MSSGIYSPWDHAPKLLRISEVLNPMEPVKWFFDAHDAEGHRETLRTWRHYAVNDEFYCDERFGPGVLFHEYELNIRLIEALYLLLLDNQVCYNKKDINLKQLSAEKEEWVWFPADLSEKELFDPYIILEAAFQEINLQEFRDNLGEWLAAALSTHAVDESVTPGEIITVYEHIKKMYSAAWIILQRNVEQPKLKKKEKLTSISDIEQDHHSGDANAEIVAGDHIKDRTQSTGWLKFGVEEAAGFIQLHNQSVELIVHMHTNEEPYMYFLLIIVEDEEQRSNEEIAVKIEEECKELVSVIVFVRKAKWFKTAGKQNTGFLGYAYRYDNIVYHSPTLTLPDEPFHWESLGSTELQEIWNDWGNEKQRSFKAASFHLSQPDSYRCLALIKQTVTNSLKGLIRIFTGHVPFTADYYRLISITMLFTDRVWNLFFKEVDSTKRAFTLLCRTIDENSDSLTDPIEEDALNVLFLNAYVLTLIADEEYTYLLYEAEHSEAAVKEAEKDN